MGTSFKFSVALLTVLVGGSGCSREADNAGQASNAQADATKPAVADDRDHKHDGWWCREHGVPEDVCGQCDSAVAADFQKKGDWCREHDRPDSQCFVCHPELEGKFAARYQAKYGTKPPKPNG